MLCPKPASSPSNLFDLVCWDWDTFFTVEFLQAVEYDSSDISTSGI